MTLLALCRPRPDADPAAFAGLLAAEADALRRLKAEGWLTAAYSPGRPGAVLLLEGDPEAADAVLADLPLVAAGLIDVELIALTPIDL